MPERILAAIDLRTSTCTDPILDTAIAVVTRRRARLTVLNVITEPDPCLPGIQQEHMRQEDLEAMENMRAPGVLPTTVCAVIDRPAWHYIAKLSKQGPTDLVVIGAVERRSGQDGPGANAAELLNHLPRPVMAVWPPPSNFPVRRSPHDRPSAP